MAALDPEARPEVAEVASTLHDIAAGVDAAAATARLQAGAPATMPLSTPVTHPAAARPAERVTVGGVAVGSAVASGWQGLTPRRRLLVAGGVLLAVLLLVLVPMLLAGGGEPVGTPSGPGAPQR
jgi:hypothetical protein